MAIHWQIQFRSLRANTLYTANVYDASYAGDPVQLTGAANPFETQEDDSDDLFQAVRTQSGYLRIVDTGKDNAGNAFDWRDLAPKTGLDRPVTLTDGSGNIVWQGYIQSQTFSGHMYEPTQEREFPLMCPLQALSGVDVRTDITGSVNFASILREIINASGMQWSWLNISGDNQQVESWLKLQVDYENFVDTEDEQQTAKYDYYTLLEEVCKFFGWMCRTDGTDIWLLSPDEQFSEDYSGIDSDSLDDLCDGKSMRAQTGSYRSVDIDDNVYASNDNEQYYMTGVNKVTVNADINKQEVVVDIPYDDIADRWKGNSVTDFTYGGNGHRFVLYGTNYYSASYSFHDMYIETNGGNANYGASFWVQEYYEGNIAYKHNYNWSTSLIVRGNVTYMEDYLFMVRSKHIHNYSRGVFAISAQTCQVFISGGSRQQFIGNGHLTCRLAIGSKWWNGSSWQSSKTTFNIPIGSEGQEEGPGMGKIIDNRSLNGIYNEYEGYGVPIGEAMGGVVEFHILGVTLDDTHGYINEVEINGLSMKFVREKALSIYSDRSVNVYTQNNSSAFPEARDIDTIFASDNGNAFGLGIIITTSGTYADSIVYSYKASGGMERPEEHLVRRMADYLSTTHVKTLADLRTDAVTVNPYTMVESAGADTSYPLSISRNWRDDVTTVVMVEV